MADIRVIGLDIAKSVFQLHGVDAGGATRAAEAADAGALVGVLCQATALSDRDRGLRILALLGPRADRAGPRGKTDASAICEALCQARQERCG